MRTTVYHVMKNEVPEDETLELVGEEERTDQDSDMLPIRVLTDFSIYRCKNREFIHPLELNVEHNADNICASGVVRPWLQGDAADDEFEDDSQDGDHNLRIKLSRILELNIHHHDFRRWMLDE